MSNLENSKNFRLVRISDLIGSNITGLLTDFRTRDANGDLMYSHQEKDGPVIVTMRSVEYRHEKTDSPTLRRMYGKDRIKWLYWTCERHHSGCNYSGIVAEDDKHRDLYLMVEASQ